MKTKKSEYVDKESLLVAFYLCVPAVNAIICSVFPNLSGRCMTFLYLALCCFIVIKILFQKKHREINYKHIVLLFLLLIFFLMTIILAPYSALKITKFFPLTLIPYLLPVFTNIDGRKLLIYLMLLPSFGIFFVNKIFYIVGYKYESVTMGISYAFLPSVIATIIFWGYYQIRNKPNICIILATLINIVYAYELIKFGSRGPILSIMLSLVCLLAVKIKDTGGFYIPKTTITLLLIFIMIVFINLQSIIVYLARALEQNDIYINALDKFLRLQNKNGDVTNGRSEIWKLAFQGFLASPLWGNGLCTSMNNYGYVYPHNFILQFLYDGGLLLSLPFILYFFMGIRIWCKNCSREQFIIGIVLILISIPSAMLSGDLWENPRLWITISYFMYFVSGGKIYQKRINNTSEMNNENTICRC